MTVRRIVASSSALFAFCLAAAPVVRADDAPTTRAVEAGATTQPASQPARGATSRPSRRQRTLMQHALERIDGDDELLAGTFDHVALAADLPATRPTTVPATTRPIEGGVVIVSPRHDFPLSGSWTSPTIRADFPFTELLPSWNVIVPEGTGARFEVRTLDQASETWSPWLYIGYWGRVTREKTRVEFEGGKVDIDTLFLDKPAKSFEVRATLYDYDLSDRRRSPILRRVAAAYSRKAPEGFANEPTSRPAPTSMPVPFRAQGVEDKAIRGSICSPTSTTMVLAWAGDVMATEHNAMAIWDDDNGLFGNWNRATQYAGSLGFDAWLQRFETMDDVRAMLATGQPVIASIRFKKGEFPSSVLKSTEGHLIVIRGFDADGNLICNDPASRDRGEAVVYKSDELARAWLLNAGGVGYIIKKP